MRGLSERDLLILLVLSSIFGASIVFANIAAGVKLLKVFGFVAPAGVIAYSVTFPITDIVDEVYGKRIATYIVWGGLLAEIFMLAMIPPAYYLPAVYPEQQEIFAKVFLPQLRIVLGSIVAYIASQHHDVWAFWKWREITGGRYLWLRNNASTIVSQLIDSSLFITIAFYGVFPTRIVFNMILTQWLVKVVIALLDTPFVYAGVYAVQRYTLSRPSGST